MPKHTMYDFVSLQAFLEDARDAKTIAAVIILALASWKGKKVNNFQISVLFEKAAQKCNFL